jgi:ATP-dependent Clp protease ATP-binding subunit ClpC
VETLGYHLDITDKAKEFVASKGYDVQYGARPLKRAIQTYIEDGLSERILSGDLNAGDTIRIDKEDDKEELTFQS